MSSTASTIIFRQGDTIFREGEAGDDALLIKSGAVSISRRGREGEVPLGTCGPGDVIGEMAIIDDSPRSATAIAAEETEVAVIKRHQLLDRLDQADPVIARIVRTLMRRFRGTEAVLLAEGDSAALRQGLTAPENNPTAALGAYGDLLREREVEDAIAEGQFEAFYQPVVALRGNSPTGVMPVGFEALVRWRHPARGIMAPEVFADLAEKSGLIVPLDRHVFGLAAAFLKQADAELGNVPLSMSVNLSSRQFRDFGIVTGVEQAMWEAGLDPRRLQVEVTESTLIFDSSTARMVVSRLVEMGVGLTLDDFGTGYSSLSYLIQFPFSVLKIDRSFVDSVLESETSEKVVRSIVGLAESMNLGTVAEGIETIDQQDRLRALGCRQGQGYLYAPPMPPDEAITWVRKIRDH